MRRAWLLGLSVALNGALLVVLWRGRSATPPTISVTPITAPAATAHPLPASAPVAVPATTTPPPTAPPATPPDLEADDYPTFINKLRAAGLNDRTIATLLVAEYQDRTANDSVALMKRCRNGELPPGECGRRQRQMLADQDAELEALLGHVTYRRYKIDHDYQLRELAASGRYAPGLLEQYFDLRRAHQKARSDLSEKLRAERPDQATARQQLQALQQTYQASLNQALGVEVARSILTATEGIAAVPDTTPSSEEAPDAPIP